MKTLRFLATWSNEVTLNGHRIWLPLNAEVIKCGNTSASLYICEEDIFNRKYSSTLRDLSKVHTTKDKEFGNSADYIGGH